VNVSEIPACRACGDEHLEIVLDLGNLCISDFTDGKRKPDRAPLVLVYCPECMLVQLRHTVSRERLYSRYTYRSGMNESMVAALQEVADEAMERRPLKLGDYVLDIGANDGTLLRMFPECTWRDGFEPSQLAAEAEKGTDHIWNTYFPSGWVPERKYSIILSCACFYDVDDPGKFVQGVKDWLRPDGIWINQMSDLGMMLNQNAFDNICHEHLTYWDYHPFHRLCRENGLRITGLSLNHVNGGSARYIVEHDTHPLPRETMGKIDMGMGAITAFIERIEHLRSETRWLLEDLKDRGNLVMGYGASTKGNTLLQYYGITPELLPAIADRNPEKVGLWTAGSNVKIISEETMRECKPDYLLILPWAPHFIEAFKVREAEFLTRGGKFILPLPQLKIIGGDDDAGVFQSATQTSAR